MESFLFHCFFCVPSLHFCRRQNPHFFEDFVNIKCGPVKLLTYLRESWLQIKLYWIWMTPALVFHSLVLSFLSWITPSRPPSLLSFQWNTDDVRSPTTWSFQQGHGYCGRCWTLVYLISSSALTMNKMICQLNDLWFVWKKMRKHHLSAFKTHKLDCVESTQ